MDTTQSFLAELERSEQIELARNESLVPTGQRPCPICANTMDVETMSGIKIDVCGDHGVWLDRGELPNILSSVDASHRKSTVKAIRKAKEEGKKAQMVFGVWSFLFD